MKKSSVFVLLLLVSLSLFFYGCGEEKKESYLRIHIRANSNIAADQDIKYLIKDKLIDYLTPLIANCNSLMQVKNVVNECENRLETICNETLKANNFNYISKISIQNEYFPTRAYGEYVLEEDFYDATIVQLGEGGGDNWWCVVYPPLCFLDAKSINGKNIKYKSKIFELINEFFD